MDSKLTDVEREIVNCLIDVGFDYEDIMNNKLYKNYVVIGYDVNNLIDYISTYYDGYLNEDLDYMDCKISDVINIDSYVSELISEGVVEEVSDGTFLVDKAYPFGEVFGHERGGYYDEYIKYTPSDNPPEDVKWAILNYFDIDFETEAYGAFYVHFNVKNDNDAKKCLLGRFGVVNRLIKHINLNEMKDYRVINNIKLTEVGLILHTH